MEDFKFTNNQEEDGAEQESVLIDPETTSQKEEEKAQLERDLADQIREDEQRVEQQRAIIEVLFESEGADNNPEDSDESLIDFGDQLNQIASTETSSNLE